MNLGSRTSYWARSKCSTIPFAGSAKVGRFPTFTSLVHPPKHGTVDLLIPLMNRTKSSDQQSTTNPTIPVCWSCNHMMCWTPLPESENVRNQRQRHRSPTIYSTLDCFIKQKESILEYNPLLILPYIWWLWPRTIPKIWWFFNPWNSPAVGKPRKPPERFVHLLATSKGLQLNTTVHGFTQGLANDWAGNENKTFDRWQTNGGVYHMIH